MNIFFLDIDADISASMMVDKHIVKMPVESAQMLSTAHRILDGKKTSRYLMDYEHIVNGEIQNKRIYKETHINHPSNIWTRYSLDNYNRHVEILVAMLNEYQRRYKKKHKVELELLPHLVNPPLNIRDIGSSEPPKVTGIFQDTNYVEAYRKFYAATKWYIGKWDNGDIPYWFMEYLNLNFDNIDQTDKLAKMKKVHPLIEQFVRSRGIS